MIDRSFIIKDTVLNLAECIGLEVSFKKVRRMTDITFLKLYGERRRVLSIPPVLEDIFQEDIEIIEGHDTGQGYVLTFAITQKLEHQSFSKGERRNKHLIRKKSELQKPNYDKNVFSSLG